MNRIASSLLAAALSASFVAADVMSVNAQPIYAPQPQGLSSDVQTVQYQEWRRHRTISRNRVYSRNGDMYWNGHRGYREYRR
ncbi:BA14K family protein, partial [Mesorhizobium sp. M1A.F.Ca.ET.072.01.1.1]